MTQALAIKSGFTPDTPYVFPSRRLSLGQSTEAAQIHEGISNVLVHLSETQTYKSAEIDAIKRLLRQGSGYASLSFITRKTGLRVEDFCRILRESNAFRKSLIVTETGDDVYMLNTPFSGLLDIWKTFCHLNAMKF